jgi:hypothetical protein
VKKGDTVEECGVIGVSGFNNAPFGVTLKDAEEYGDMLEKNALRIHNAPVRDVEKQSFWDFMSEPVPEEESLFTPEVMDAFRGWPK